MKMKIKVIFIILVLIPFIKVRALECYGNNESDAIDLNTINNFTCKDIKGDKLSFTSNGEDVSKYFELNEDKTRINIVDKSLKFAPEFKNGIIVIKDDETSTIIYIQNNAYTTTQKMSSTTSTTTTNVNSKTYTVSLDSNDGSDVIKKTCTITGQNTTCNITLPQVDKESFNGWGTAKTCKEGNIGTIKVEKDITYFACYKDNVTSSTPSNILFLKTLSLINKDNNEEIKFGTFSIKKQEYTFKVLNEVNNIDVQTTADDGINIEVTGNENLVEGENKIVIKLSDDSNNQGEYILNVIKLKKGETLNNVNYLESLVIGGYNINFKKEQFVYNLTIPKDVDKLAITAIPENKKVKKDELNNENLVDGSQILIKLTDENGEFTTYTINISKENDSNIYIYFAIVVIALLIILLIVLLIIKLNQKKKQTKNTNIPKVLDTKKDNLEVLNI